jgi:hypothetical protein
LQPGDVDSLGAKHFGDGVFAKGPVVEAILEVVVANIECHQPQWLSTFRGLVRRQHISGDYR